MKNKYIDDSYMQFDMAATRAAAAVLVSIEDASILGASLSRTQDEMPVLTCQVATNSTGVISAGARDWAQRRLTDRWCVCVCVYVCVRV